MPQWNWIVWALVSIIANQTKVDKVTKTINLAQLYFFVAKRATLPENTSIFHTDHLLLILLKTHKNIGDAKHFLQGIIASPRHPTDQAIPLTLDQMTPKYPTTLLMFQLMAMYHQHTTHH